MKKKENKIVNIIRKSLNKTYILNFLIVVFIIFLYIFVFLAIYTNFRERKRKETTNVILKKIDNIISKNKNNIEKEYDVISYDTLKYTVLGKLKIDKINIYEPILKENTKSSMDVSVVKIYGPSLNSNGNVVLGAHNFMKGDFFIKIMKLINNDEIKITDLSGKTVSYYVYDYYKTEANDAQYFKQPDNKNEKIITLVTCTKGGKERYIVKAKAK